MTELPTNAEIARRLDEAVRTIERLALTLETSYVRKEVYEARHEAIRREHAANVKEVSDDVAEIKRQRADDANRWKQALFAIGVQIIMLLIIGGVAVSNFMARAAGGG